MTASEAAPDAVPRERSAGSDTDDATLPSVVPADTDAIVIDLTGDTPSRTVAPERSAVPARHGARRWRWAIALPTVVALVATVLAVTNYTTAMQWRANALAQSSRADRADAAAAAERASLAAVRTELRAVQREGEAVAARLAVSEADVSALEARIAMLADDRAQVEDRGGRGSFGDTTRQMRVLTRQVDGCLAQVAALRADLRRDDPNVDALRKSATAAQSACDQVGADVATLASDG